MNATWGLFPPLAEELRRNGKRERARHHLGRARASFARMLESHPELLTSVGPAEPAAEPAAIEL